MSGYEPAAFSVTVDERDDRCVVVVTGELDLMTAPELEDVVLPLVRAGRHVVVDLRALSFMDSSGVRVVVAAHVDAGENGGGLSLTRLAPGTPVQRVLEISGLDGVLDVVDDV